VSAPVVGKIDSESRGALPTNYLCDTKLSPHDYTRQLSHHHSSFAGFNLLVGHITPSSLSPTSANDSKQTADSKQSTASSNATNEWSYISNHPQVNWTPRTVNNGIHSISNAYMDPPREWYKVTRGKQLFADVIKYVLDIHSPCASCHSSYLALRIYLL
jgi:uncharacterized protein with NRDE domain